MKFDTVLLCGWALVIWLGFLSPRPAVPHSPLFVERWQMNLDTPGGPLPFELDALKTQQSEEPIKAEIVNGPERIPVALRFGQDGHMTLKMEHYDSEINLKSSDGVWRGVWTKTRGPGKVAEVPCSAVRFAEHSYSDPAFFLGRWQVHFSESEDPAIGIFQGFGRNEVLGTFLTTTGDYRYLHGFVIDGKLQLSCFDGAHAFLFRAAKHVDGSLNGHFWSGNWHHETWTAHRAPDAKLPDGFEQTVATEEAQLGDLKFPDLAGRPRTLIDPEFRGKVTLIEIFGSWCPNCHDEAAYLSELKVRYGALGLQVLGLAFELTGDFERDVLQVKRYCRKYDVDYPILLAGTSDKAEASKTLPMLDRLRSYPTTLFVDQGGTIRAVYTGFAGPATGDEYMQLRRRFEAIIEKLLAE